MNFTEPETGRMKLSHIVGVLCVSLAAFMLIQCRPDPVAPIPVASFNFVSNPAGVIPVPKVKFNNTSSDAVKYVWDFGDGTTSTEISPTHTYAVNDTFLVRLTAIGPGGEHTGERKLIAANVLIGAWEMFEYTTAECSFAGLHKCSNPCQTLEFSLVNGVRIREPGITYPNCRYEVSGASIKFFCMDCNEGTLFTTYDNITFAIVGDQMTITAISPVTCLGCKKTVGKYYRIS